jgi:HK97 family phage prohead protease
MEIERRAFSMLALEVEARSEGESPIIRGHAAVFDRMSENLGGFREKIDPGAFDDVLGDDVRALFNHDANLILGRTTSGTLRLSQDGEGLSYELDPPDTQVGRDLMVSLKRGDITQSSFAFTVADDDWSEDEEGRVVRTIKKVGRLYDVSPVTYPAYPDASVGLRSLQAWQQSRQKMRPVGVLRRRLELLAR